MIYIVMGVSGCGKTTIGSLLARELAIPFHDADDFHPQSNRQKMQSGFPLTDADRLPWLQRLHDLIAEAVVEQRSLVLACSALKKRYRDMLRQDHDKQVRFIHLVGSISVIAARMQQRPGHYMPPSLLASQFGDLEAPEDAISVSIEQAPENIVAAITSQLNQNSP